MRWNAKASATGRIFGTVVDTILQRAACQVVLVKLSELTPIDLKLDKWLIPIAGGPNAEAALQLLPALVSQNRQSVVELCQVFETDEVQPNTYGLEKSARLLSKKLQATVKTTTLKSDSVSQAIINLAATSGCDAVMVGASREGFLQQAINGNVPEAIARGVKGTAILVRSL